jgi:hypothetical protein
LSKIITGLFVGFAAVVAVIGNMDGAITSWCKYFGFLCAYEVTGPLTTAKITGGNPCSNQFVPLCIEPTTKYRRLILSTMKFVTTKPVGTFKDGVPLKGDETTAGWFHQPNDSFNSEKICITVFARTGACEIKPDITGQPRAMERITIF